MVVEALASALKKHPIAACVVQPHFQNPIGSLMPDSNKKALAALADEHSFTIIKDDVYGDLAHDGGRPTSIAVHSERVIHCGSVSKTIAPGLRGGWMVPGAHLASIFRDRIPWEKALEVLKRGGKLSEADYLRCKVRYFSDGAVIGGKAFVEDMFAAFCDRFGPKRKDGARPLRGLAGKPEDRLFNFRQLRTGVFG